MSLNANTRVFGWKSILAEWNTGNIAPPHPVETVLQNLSRRQSPPASHFFTYLNEENEGLLWFIYECIASSWMWESGPRLHYIQQALDLVESLESTFPAFPGSPVNSHTLRSFLTAHLTEDQLTYIQLMPALVPMPEAVPVAEPKTKNATIHFHILRDLKSNHDDIITIRKLRDDTYSYTLKDKTSTNDCVNTQKGLDRDQVISILRTTLNMLILDDEPYYAVQVILPTFPSVMLKVESLTAEVRDRLYDAVEMTMDSWPTYLV
jgi:hypothetical protein